LTDRNDPYQIEWSASAKRAIVGLPDKVASAIIDFVYGPLADNPQRVGRPLRWELEGLHAARRGDYRIVYHVDTEGTVVVIEAVAHRSDVYRRR